MTLHPSVLVPSDQHQIDLDINGYGGAGTDLFTFANIRSLPPGNLVYKSEAGQAARSPSRRIKPPVFDMNALRIKQHGWTCCWFLVTG